MSRGKRFGWAFGALGLVAILGFASMIRVSFNPAPPPAAPRAQAPAAFTAFTPPLPRRADPAPLVIPVQGVASRQLSDTWGQSRGGGAREHHAIDILAPRGTPVLAAASGTVEKIFESANGGHTIYVRTPDGATIHYYAHLDRYGVGEKQLVQQGQVIGWVGDTGSAAGGAPHLHFEIKAMRPGEGWWQGANVNPYPLLARIGGGS